VRLVPSRIDRSSAYPPSLPKFLRVHSSSEPFSRLIRFRESSLPPGAWIQWDFPNTRSRVCSSLIIYFMLRLPPSLWARWTRRLLQLASLVPMWLCVKSHCFSHSLSSPFYSFPVCGILTPALGLPPLFTFRIELK